MVQHAKNQHAIDSKDLHESARMDFHGTTYVVSIHTFEKDTLRVEVELEADASRWLGDFSTSYINEVTAKTGNYKTFPVFVRMLSRAVRQTSDSVCIDLLTYSDLEVLKAKRLKRAGQDVPAQHASTAAHSKRYLILTYQGEFDKTHYPLPLVYEDNPDPSLLKRTIAELRARLHEAEGIVRPSLEGELHELREENSDLRCQVEAIEGRAATDTANELARATAALDEAAAEARALRADNEELRGRLEEAEAAAEEARLTHRRALRQKAREVSEAQTELGQLRARVRELRSQNRNLQAELDAVPRKRHDARPFVLESPLRSSAPDAAAIAPAVHSRQRSRWSDSPYADPPSRRPRRTASLHSDEGVDVLSSSERPRAGRSPLRRPPQKRSTSAPASRPRFDPTEYVQQKRARAEAQAARLTRTFSPAGSRSASRGPSPTPEFTAGSRIRASSAREASSPAQRGARSRSAGAVSVSGSLPSQRGPALRTAARTREGRAGAARQAWERPSTDGFARRPMHASVGSAVHRSSEGLEGAYRRSESPGRALRDVKEKLKAFKSRSGGSEALERGDGAVAASGPRQRPSSMASANTVRIPSATGAVARSWKAPASDVDGHRCQADWGEDDAATADPGGVYDDASSEIADIDMRLQALQDFLKSAKASSGR